MVEEQSGLLLPLEQFQLTRGTTLTGKGGGGGKLEETGELAGLVVQAAASSHSSLQ